MFKPDLADSAAIAAEVTAHPSNYTIGTQITAANGDTSIVTAVGTVVAIIPLVEVPAP
jgi:hypothetical protein